MSHLWEKGIREKKEKRKQNKTKTEGGKKAIEKERKEGSRNKERSEAR